MRARKAPRCPHCGEVVAKAVVKKNQPMPVVGDNFLRWEYEENHKCKRPKAEYEV